MSADSISAATRKTQCAECGSPCKEALYGLPPVCCWSCAAKVDARKHRYAARGTITSATQEPKP